MAGARGRQGYIAQIVFNGYIRYCLVSKRLTEVLCSLALSLALTCHHSLPLPLPLSLTIMMMIITIINTPSKPEPIIWVPIKIHHQKCADFHCRAAAIHLHIFQHSFALAFKLIPASISVLLHFDFKPMNMFVSCNSINWIKIESFPSIFYAAKVGKKSPDVPGANSKYPYIAKRIYLQIKLGVFVSVYNNKNNEITAEREIHLIRLSQSQSHFCSRYQSQSFLLWSVHRYARLIRITKEKHTHTQHTQERKKNIPNG